jgi:hypothetical protein
MPRANGEWGFQVQGLNEFRRALKAADPTIGKEIGKETQRIGQTVFEPEARRRGAGRTNPRPGHIVLDSIRSNRVQSGVEVSMGGKSIPWAKGHEFGSNKYKQFPVPSGRLGRGSAGYFFWPAARWTRDKAGEAFLEVLDRVMARAYPEGHV